MKGMQGAGEPSSTARRELLKAAMAGAGLATLPATSALALTVAKVAPSLLIGYCPPSSLTGGGVAALTDSSIARPLRGNYELRVVGAGTDGPLALSAQYAAVAEHRFWQAWREGGLLQRSAPIAIRWAAAAGNALPVNVRTSAGTQTAEITARPGVYAILLVPATQRVPDWGTLGLREQFTGGVDYKLVSRVTGAECALPHALFSVETIKAHVV